MHPLSQRVLSHIRRDELLQAGERVGVAVSSGTDSVALLRLLLELRSELGIVLSVVHFNHKLRGAESDSDQEFVAGLAREHDLEFFSDGHDVAARAAEERISVETAARELRYGFFQSLLAGEPRGLKPDFLISPLRGPEGPLFHGAHQSFHGDGEGRPGAHEGRSRVACLHKIVTGHTLDDQAETVLMRIIRGAGLRGLGGIYSRIQIEDDGEVCGEIVRPLLNIRHRELELYLKGIGQAWREDSSNADERFTRNRVRKLIVPLLEKEFNPAVAENLAELAEIARGEEDYWENEIAGWLGTTVQWSEPDWARPVSERRLVQITTPGGPSTHSSPTDPDLELRIESAPWKVVNASVSRMWFLAEPLAVQRRLVKAIGEHAGIAFEFRHVEEILRFAADDGQSGKELSLPLGWKLLREPEQLLFVTPDLRDPAPAQDYEYELSVPGRITVAEVGSSFEAQRIPAGKEAGYNPENLLAAESLPGLLRVRNWRAGDRYWPAHTKSPKKIKELLQERHVALPERRLWPVLVSGDEIVWMRGFPVPAKFRAKAGQEAILIVETGSQIGRHVNFMNGPRVEPLRPVITTEQIQKRIKELGRQISDDYKGQTIQILAVLENAFMFQADLVRALEVPVVCQFIKPRYKQTQDQSANPVMEIFFSHEPDIRGQHLLLVEGLVHSGVTSEFLMSDLRARGAASVKLVTLLDRQSARRVPLQPDYFGFLVDETFLVGYGLGAVEQTSRNLPYLAAATTTTPVT